MKSGNTWRPTYRTDALLRHPYIGHNSVVFQNRISKFCMELNLDNIHLPYHSKTNQTSPNHTNSNHTKPNILKLSITLLFFKLGARNFPCNYI